VTRGRHHTGDNSDVTKRCLVVEDDHFTRVTLSSALQSEGFVVVAAVGSASEAMPEAHGVDIDVAVLDLDLGRGPTGIDLAFGLRRLNPSIGIVLLTSFRDPRLLNSSSRQLPPGSTYLVKQSLTDIGMLTAAIHGAAQWPTDQAATKPSVDLSDTQIETLRFLAYGLTNAEIARVRSVSVKSVEKTLRILTEQLGLERESGSNLRVALAREYFHLTGSLRMRDVTN